MRLESYLSQERTVVIESAADRSAVFRKIAEAASKAAGGAPPAEALVEALEQREAQMPTSTPEGVAFPHALLPDFEQTLIVAARLAPGVGFGGKGHPPSDLVFAMFGSSAKPWEHVRLLARLARVARGPGALARLRKTADAEALYSALIDEDRTHV